MKNMSPSLLTGSIAALLMASAITGFSITNTVPHSWSFESYTNGADIADANGSDGWYGASGVLVATNDTYPPPQAGYPIDTTHEVYAHMTGPVTNAITGGSDTNIWIDCMIKPEQWKQEELPSAADLPGDTQMAYLVNTNDHLVIWHMGVDTNANGDALSNMWSEITLCEDGSSVTISTNEGTRISIGIDYVIHDTQRCYYRVKVNGKFVKHEDGKVDPFYVQSPQKLPDYSGGGTYFALAYDAATKLNAILLRGNGSFDDFVVSTNAPTFEIKYIITSSVMAGASGGTLNPEGNVSVDGGSNQVFNVTASNLWTIDKVVYEENGVTKTNTTAPFDVTFTNVTANGSVYAYFVADSTNGVPLWWLDSSSGVTTNSDPSADPDHDGFTTKEEWMASTDPGNSNSYLRISRTWQANGTNYVQWESVNIDSELPPFDMMTTTDLVNTAFSPAGTVVRGATNLWMEPIPAAGTFYKVSVTNAP